MDPSTLPTMPDGWIDKSVPFALVPLALWALVMLAKAMNQGIATLTARRRNGNGNGPTAVESLKIVSGLPPREKIEENWAAQRDGLREIREGIAGMSAILGRIEGKLESVCRVAPGRRRTR